MVLFNEIKNWLVRTFIVLIGLLLFTISSISVSANSISYEHEYRSCSSVNLKITEEISFKTIENELANCCQNQRDLVDYRNWAIGAARNAAKGVTTEMTTVGRWMSKGEYEAMKSGTTVLEGAGGQTFVTQGGSHLFSGATRGSVYAEFQVPTNSLLQGGKEGWFKMLGPNASKSQQYMLQKQGGSLLPQYQNLSPILKTK